MSTALAAGLLAVASPAAAAQDVGTERLSGADRYATAVDISQAMYDPGAAAAVVLARGDVGADALAASSLAGAVDGPILLSQADRLPATSAAEITRLGADRVYIVGGTGAISANVVAQLGRLGFTGDEVVRVAGADRFATAAAVATWVAGRPDAALPELDVDGTGGSGTAAETVILANGLVLADALSAGPLSHQGFPVVLTDGRSLTAETRAAIAGRNVLIVGGTGAVSAEVAAAADAAGGTVVRVSGQNRYGTATALADFAATMLDFDYEDAILARGDAGNFADALAAGPLGGQIGAPILLVSGVNTIPDEAGRFLVAHADTLNLLVTAGGTGVVSDALLATAARAAGDVTAPQFFVSAASVTSTDGTSTVVVRGTFDDAPVGTVTAANFGLDLDPNDDTVTRPSADSVAAVPGLFQTYEVTFTLDAETAALVGGDQDRLLVTGVRDVAGNTRSGFSNITITPDA